MALQSIAPHSAREFYVPTYEHPLKLTENILRKCTKVDSSYDPALRNYDAWKSSKRGNEALRISGKTNFGHYAEEVVAKALAISGEELGYDVYLASDELDDGYKLDILIGSKKSGLFVGVDIKQKKGVLENFKFKKETGNILMEFNTLTIKKLGGFSRDAMEKVVSTTYNGIRVAEENNAFIKLEKPSIEVIH